MNSTLFESRTYDQEDTSSIFYLAEPTVAGMIFNWGTLVEAIPQKVVRAGNVMTEKREQNHASFFNRFVSGIYREHLCYSLYSTISIRVRFFDGYLKFDGTSLCSKMVHYFVCPEQ